MRFARLCAPALIVFLAAGPAAADPITPDPVGDQINTPPSGPDVIGIVASPGITPGFMTFRVIFAGPIAPPSQFAPNSVVGYIDIDVDRNPATGLAGGISSTFAGIPPFDLGAERTIDLGSELFHGGLVDILDPSTFAVVGQAPITFGGSELSVAVPFGLLGPGFTGLVNYAGVIGNFQEPTDRVPNGAAPITSVPEPASLAVLGGLCAAAVGLRRRPVARTGTPAA